MVKKDINPLFTTTIRNDEGLEGTAKVLGGGLAVLTSSPMNKKPGTNPEELFALSWATCLNTTIRFNLKRNKYKNYQEIDVVVDIQVDYMREEDSDQTYFKFHVIQKVDLSQEEAELIVEEAHRRCPVSKIVGDYPHVTQEVIGNNL